MRKPGEFIRKTARRLISRCVSGESGLKMIFLFESLVRFLPCLPRLVRRITPMPPDRPEGSSATGQEESWEPCPFPPGSFVDVLKGRRGGFTKANLTPNFVTMITKILIAVASLIFVLVIIVVLQPSEFRVTRTGTVSAPPAVAFDQVNCDKMVGGMFEEGLSNLKAIAEAETKG